MFASIVVIAKPPAFWNIIDPPPAPHPKVSQNSRVSIISHCYFAKLNLKKMGPLQFFLPVFLEIHRNPKQKEIFNSCEGFLK
jgi:hypothetical protein